MSLSSKRTLYFDIESHNAGRELEMTPQEFVRLFQYAWDDGPVHKTTDYEEMLGLLREADYVVGHNCISFDLTAVFGYESIEPLYMAMERKVIDTFYLANLLMPAPQAYKRRDGSRRVDTADPVGYTMGWLGLDNLCYQIGLPGKMGDLQELAKKHNPPKTKVKDLDYGLIPLDDPEFLEYADQDVISVRGLYKHLLQEIKRQDYPGEYIWREMEVLSAVVGQMHRNGILVDQEFAKERIQTQDERKEELMTWLVENYDFPTEGKSPWASAKGKEATLRVLKDFGFTPENTPEWPLTPKGAPKLGGSDLMLFAQGTEAEEFVTQLGELKGQRSTAQLVLENVKPDGRVHPDITALQRSGRFSFTRPGVTIFGERTEELKRDKKLFTAAPGNVMAGLDYSSADARAMAALSGDHEYARRFEEDEEGNAVHDGHNLTGESIFGPDVYYGDGPRDKSARPILRAASKVFGHAQNYQAGGYKIATGLNLVCKQEGIDMFFWAPAGKNKDGSFRAKPITVPDEFSHIIVNDKYTGAPVPDNFLFTRDMLERSREALPFLTRFKELAYREAEELGYITNSWGRRIHIHESGAYTGGPAGYGQSTTTEMMKDAILRLIRKGEYYIRSLRAIIHDELLLEFNEETVERDMAVAKECMEVDFEPHTPWGFPISFPTGTGYGKTWFDASH